MKYNSVQHRTLLTVLCTLVWCVIGIHTAQAAIIEVLPETQYELGWVPYRSINGGYTRISPSCHLCGDGSMGFWLPEGNSQAEYVFGSGKDKNFTNLGKLDEFTSLSFYWFRASTFTADNSHIPNIKFYVYDPDTGLEHLFIRAHEYNEGANEDVGFNKWYQQTVTVDDNWFQPYLTAKDLRDLDDWGLSSNAYIYALGISAGPEDGGNWGGTYLGWVDLVSLNFQNQETIWNFNFTTGNGNCFSDPIPEPATISLLALGLTGLAYRLRKRH